MKNLKSHFQFNKRERSGIFFLLVLIIIFQVFYFYLKNAAVSGDSMITLDARQQATTDSLKTVSLKEGAFKIYPFNPNFISDYKGYTLGMSPSEIDRLHAFRENNSFINSKEQFQQVTQISDSLLVTIAPYFKFPDWVNESKPKVNKPKSKVYAQSTSIQIKDINQASAEELKVIRGIGDKLSARIVKFRDRLGGFLVNEQLYDVYGLDVEVADRVLKNYKVLNPPEIKKININTASQPEIASLVYFSYDMADKIIEYRMFNDRIDSFEELSKIEGFPTEKLDRIALYLSL